MKFTELKDLNKSELLIKADGLKKEIFAARMKHSMGQLGNPLQIRKLRKDLARVLTADSGKRV